MAKGKVKLLNKGDLLEKVKSTKKIKSISDKRLEIKKLILNKSQGTHEIPLLSYSNIEIIDPYSVNEKLIELLDNDELEGGFTDKRFFKCLEESPDYLAYEPFRRKIKEWKELLHGELQSKEKRKEAKVNLLRVGKTLAHEGQGRPIKHNDIILWVIYKDTVKAMESFLGEVKGLSYHAKAESFRKKFPGGEEYASIFKTHRTAKEIAKALIEKRYNISKRVLNYLRKSAEETIGRTPPQKKQKDKATE